MLSRRIQRLSSSMTMAITSLASELKAEGKNILSFSAGEPDFDTPKVIKDSAKKAIDEGKTKYTSIQGISELLQAIVEKLKRDNGLEYATNQIQTNNGAKHSLFNLFQALIDDGDEVIIPAPYWVTYPEIVKYSGGKSIIIDTDDKTDFKITPKQLQEAITDKTKILILTSPSNPTGAVYSRKELEGLGEVLKGTSIFVVSDEMYEKLVYDDTEFVATASVSEDMYNRTITVNGLSKSAAMTGWRFGYVAVPDAELLKVMNKLQSQSTSNINSITQVAAIKGLDGSIDEDIEKMRKEFEIRRNEAVKLINSVERLSVTKPDGAFYLFINIKEVTNDSIEFSKKLLEEEGVAVVPGIGFGSEGYIRFSFATSIANIREGVNRMTRFIENNYPKTN